MRASATARMKGFKPTSVDPLTLIPGAPGKKPFVRQERPEFRSPSKVRFARPRSSGVSLRIAIRPSSAFFLPEVRRTAGWIRTSRSRPNARTGMRAEIPRSRPQQRGWARGDTAQPREAGGPKPVRTGPVLALPWRGIPYRRAGAGAGAGLSWKGGLSTGRPHCG